MNTSGVNQPAREPIKEKTMARCNWDLCSQLLDSFWTRWIKEYLPTITKRTKWFKDCKPVKAGDLVVAVEDRLRNNWLRGRVLRVFPGSEGCVRYSEVTTGSAEVLVRSVAVLEAGGTATKHGSIWIRGCSERRSTSMQMHSKILSSMSQ